MSGQERILAGYVRSSDSNDESEVEIQVEARVHSISHLSTTEQTFRIMFEFWILEPMKRSDFESYCRSSPPLPLWEPSLYEVICFNAVEEIEHSLARFGNKQNFKVINTEKEYNDKTKIMAYCYLLRLDCVTHMNLQNFPFDVQKLMVKLALRKDSGLYHRGSGSSFDSVVRDAPPAAFKILKPSAAFASTMLNGNYALDEFDVQKDIDAHLEGADQYIILNFTVKRRWKYYFWGVAFILILLNLISLFTLLAYSFDAVLSTASTMIVAKVAFLFIIRGMLPKTNVLTLIDKYVYCSFLLDFAVLLKVVAGEVDSLFVATSRKWVDIDRKVLLLGNFAACIIMHMVLFIYAMCSHNAEKKKIDCKNLLNPELSSDRYNRQDRGREGFA